MAASLLLALALAAPDSGAASGARAVARATATILSGETVDFGDFERLEDDKGAEAHPARYVRPGLRGERPESELRLVEFH